MKRTLVLATICFMLAGCSSFNSTSIQRLKNIHTVTVLDFDCKEPVNGKLIADAIRAELAQAGLEIIDDNNADVVISGSVSIGQGGWITGIRGWVDSVVVLIKNKNGQLLASSRFDQGSAAVGCWGAKSPADIGHELGKKIINLMIIPNGDKR